MRRSANKSGLGRNVWFEFEEKNKKYVSFLVACVKLDAVPIRASFVISWANEPITWES